MGLSSPSNLSSQWSYALRQDGFAGAITYGVFLPGPAFDGTTLPAKPAHAVRARLWFVF